MRLEAGAMVSRSAFDVRFVRRGGWWDACSVLRITEPEGTVAGRVPQARRRWRAIKDVAVRSHPRRVHDQNDRFAVPRTDLHRGGRVRGEVDVVPGHLEEAVAENRSEVAVGGAVKQLRRAARPGEAEDRRRRNAPGWRESWCRCRRRRSVACRSTATTSSSSSRVKRTPPAAAAGEQVIDRNPAAGFECEAELLRLVPEVRAQELADADPASSFMGRSPWQVTTRPGVEDERLGVPGS